MARGMRRLRGDERGATTIEFAVLATPFFLVLFAVAEIALVFIAAMQFEQATDRVSRQIMTGEIEGEPELVRERLCGALVLPLDCRALRVDYRELATVSGFALPSPVEDRRIRDASFIFEAMEQPSFASLRVGYEWPLALDPLSRFFAGLEGGRVLMLSTSLIRMER